VCTLFRTMSFNLQYAYQEVYRKRFQNGTYTKLSVLEATKSLRVSFINVITITFNVMLIPCNIE